VLLFLQSNDNSCNARKYCTYTAAAAGSLERVGLLQYMRVELFKNILVLYQNIFIDIGTYTLYIIKEKLRLMTPALGGFSHLHYINKHRVDIQYPKINKKLEKQTEIEDTIKEQKRETVEEKKAQQPRGNKIDKI
jgi:hypothetical protein